MKKTTNIILLISLIVLFFSCSENSRREREIANIEMDIKIERFDEDLTNCSNNFSNEEISKMSEKYLEFFDIYNERIIMIGNANTPHYHNNLKLFLDDYSVKEAYKQVKEVYYDTEELEENIQKVFKHVAYYYPEYKIPRLATYVSGFNQSIVITENFIAVGLDKYLGENCKLYDMLSVQKYLRHEMSPDFIPADISRAVAEDICINNPENVTLLSEMMYNAKVMYFIKTMIPDLPDEILFKYTKEQLEYCKANEKAIWALMIEKKILFSTDFFEIKKLTQNAPFSTMLGPDSPPRIANWIAYQILQSYMENNSCSLQELMANNNYQLIMQLSQY